MVLGLTQDSIGYFVPEDEWMVGLNNGAYDIHHFGYGIHRFWVCFGLNLVSKHFDTDYEEGVAPSREAVSFRLKNLHFLSKSLHFLLKNLHFLLKNLHLSLLC